MSIQQGATDTWIKSSHSGGNGACVEVKSPAMDMVAVRDSKNPSGPSLMFTPESWTVFVREVDRGSFDLH